MNYSVQKGIVLVSVGDQYLLVAAKGARDHCPYVTQITESAALIYKSISEGFDVDDICRKMFEVYEITQDINIKEQVESCIHQLMDMGYVNGGLSV